MFSSIFDDGPRNEVAVSKSDVNAGFVDQSVEVKISAAGSSRSIDSAQWDRLVGLVEMQKKEVALSINSLKRDIDDQKKDFKEYVSRATREDAAIHIAAGKERKEAMVAIAEVHTDIELLKGELKKMRTASLQGQVPGKVESHVLKERIKAVETKLDDVAANVDPLHSKVGVAVGQLDRKLHGWSEEFHSRIRAEMEKLQAELDGIRGTAVPLERKVDLHAQEVHARIEDETGKLRMELHSIRDSTLPLRDDIESRTQTMHARIKDETTRLWTEFGDLRDSAGTLRRDLESHQQETHARIQDEAGKLQVAVDEVRKSVSSQGAKSVDEAALARKEDELKSLIRSLDARAAEQSLELRKAHEAEAKARQSAEEELRGLLRNLDTREAEQALALRQAHEAEAKARQSAEEELRGLLRSLDAREAEQALELRQANDEEVKARQRAEEELRGLLTSLDTREAEQALELRTAYEAEVKARQSTEEEFRGLLRSLDAREAEQALELRQANEEEVKARQRAEEELRGLIRDLDARLEEEAAVRRETFDAEVKSRMGSGDQLAGLVKSLDARLARVEAEASRTTELSEILASRMELLAQEVRGLEDRGPRSPDRLHELQKAVELGEILARKVDQQGEQLQELRNATRELEQHCSSCADRCTFVEERFAESKLSMELAARDSIEGVEQRRREDEASRQALTDALDQQRLALVRAEQVGEVLAGTARVHDEQLKGLRSAQEEVDRRCAAVEGRCEWLAGEVADSHALEIQSLKQSHDDLANLAEKHARDVGSLREANQELVEQCKQAVENCAGFEVSFGERCRFTDGSLRELRHSHEEEVAARSTQLKDLEARLEHLCTEQNTTLKATLERDIAECTSAIAECSKAEAQLREEELKAREAMAATLELHTSDLQVLSERYERETAETRQLALSAPQEAKDTIEEYRRKVQRAVEVSEIVAERQEGILLQLQGASTRLQDDFAEIRRTVDAQRKTYDEVVRLVEEHRLTVKEDLIKAVEGEMAVRRRSVEEEKQARIVACDALDRSIQSCASSLACLEQQLCTSVDGSN